MPSESILDNTAARPNFLKQSFDLLSHVHIKYYYY